MSAREELARPPLFSRSKVGVFAIDVAFLQCKTRRIEKEKRCDDHAVRLPQLTYMLRVVELEQWCHQRDKPISGSHRA